MNLTLENQRLWWKEIRQMYPLILMLLTMVPLMLLVYFTSELTVNPGYGISPAKNWPLYFVLGLPGVFAVGAGMLLVGQEKEQRTMSWLSNLPIAPSRLINVKFNSALLAVGMLWLICLPIASFLNPEKLTNSGWALILRALFWVTYSLFLLTWSFAISWRINGVFAALMTLVPMAILPVVLIFVAESTLGSWKGPLEELSIDQISIVVLFLLTVLGWFLVHRFGLAALAPEKLAPEKALMPSDRIQAGKLTAESYRSQAELAGYYRPMRPWSALCWQAFTQYSWLNVFLLGMLLVGGMIQVNQLTNSHNSRLPILETFFPAPFAFYLFAASWLGVLAFQGDSHLKRVLFLSDRGVSPGMVWSTRHFSGVLVILIFLLLFSGLLRIFDRLGSSFFSNSLLIFSVGVFLLAIYFISQWISQILPGPVISAIVVPILTSVLVMMGYFYLFCVGSPFWLVALVTLIPLAASWIGKRMWMEQRPSKWGWLGWCGQGLVLFSMLAIPVLPGLLAIQRTPGMSTELDTQLRNIALNASAENLSVTHSRFEIQKEADSLKEIQEQNLRFVEHLLNSDGMNGQLIQIANQFASYAELSRASWKGTAPDRESIQLYQKSIASIFNVVKKESRHTSLLYRDLADQLEIFLLGELKMRDARERIGDDLFEKIAETLGDRKGRNQARRKALAHSYVDSQENWNQWQNLGGYFQHDVASHPSWINFQIRTRRSGTLIEDLARLLDSTPGSVDRELIERIAKDWQASADQYQSISSNQQSFSLDVHQMRFNRWGQNAPGLLWHGSWEREGEEFLKKIRESNQPPAVSD